MSLGICGPVDVSLLLLTSFLSIIPQAFNDFINVVMIISRSKELDHTCQWQCNAIFLTDTMLLTVASCIGPNSTFSDDETISSEARPGYVTVYINLQYEIYKNVTHIFVYPGYNSTSMVGDLAVVVIDSAFAQIGGTGIKLLDISLQRIPNVLTFKGVKIKPFKTKIEQATTDFNTLKHLKIVYEPNKCPAAKDGVIWNDTYWWSFLCTTSDSFRVNNDNLLCNSDRGGPLFDDDKLYGIYSHAYNTKYPFCAQNIKCDLLAESGFPCFTDTVSSYYRHTAIIGRYAYWLNRIIEEFPRIITTSPTCPPPPGELTTTQKQEYDDEYANHHRPMVSNHKVCPKVKLSSAATTYTVAATIVATEIAVIVVLISQPNLTSDLIPG